MNGLVAVVGAAAAYDVWAAVRHHESLTCGFKRTRDNPAGRLLIGAAIGALLVHLFEE